MKIVYLGGRVHWLFLLATLIVSCRESEPLPRSSGLRLTKTIRESSGSVSTNGPEVTNLIYDDNGKLLRQKTESTGAIIEYKYAGEKLIEVFVINRKFDTTTHFVNDYNSIGQISECSWFSGKSKRYSFVYKYDESNRVSEESVEYSQTFKRQFFYVWKDENVILRRVFDNGKFNTIQTYQVESDYNPYQLLPVGTGPFNPISSSKNAIHEANGLSRKATRDKNGYPKSIRQSTGGLFGYTVTTEFEYQKY